MCPNCNRVNHPWREACVWCNQKLKKIFPEVIYMRSAVLLILSLSVLAILAVGIHRNLPRAIDQAFAERERPNLYSGQTEPEVWIDSDGRTWFRDTAIVSAAVWEKFWE